MLTRAAGVGGVSLTLPAVLGYADPSMTQDPRQLAQVRVAELVSLLKAQPDAAAHAGLLEEAEALERAIRAFHMEGIRFRIYNVDRLLTRAGTAVPDGARVILEDARHHLEAAGFHTRSHQAPT